MKKKASQPDSLSDFVEIATIRITREKFCADLREFLTSQVSELSLTKIQLGELFEITDEYLRLDSAVMKMKTKEMTCDLAARRKLISRTQKHFSSLTKIIKTEALDVRRPITAFLAQNIRETLTKCQEQLEHIFNSIKLTDRVSKSMLRMASLKILPTEYVLELDNYLAAELPQLPIGHREIVIAGVKQAANLLTAKEKRADNVSAIPMARSRAKQYEKQLQKSGVELVVRKRPNPT